MVYLSYSIVYYAILSEFDIAKGFQEKECHEVFDLFN